MCLPPPRPSHLRHVPVRRRHTAWQEFLCTRWRTSRSTWLAASLRSIPFPGPYSLRHPKPLGLINFNDDEPQPVIAPTSKALKPEILPPASPTHYPVATQMFAFHGFSVRVVMKDDEPWRVASDACAVLDIANPRDTMSPLDADEKSTVGSTDGCPDRNIINESGLYSLILGSRKPEAKAKAFKKWITSVVLPSFRKTGSDQM